MIGIEDAPYTYEYEDYYKVLPAIHDWNKDPVRIKDGVKVDKDFIYTSENNTWWMSKEELNKWIHENLG